MNTTTKPARHQVYNVLSWICLVLVVAKSAYAGAAGAVPMWLAVTNVIVFGAIAVQAIRVTRR
ncbi:hypothetical protein BH92_27540 (plasmid) [Rhodococcoides fascians A21d2]|uniref:hypothetical protein n=1 Tax=Rhodococcoides fascians TaxID=1828 RepID=UPI000A7F108C|nr:hypothetical protein [Rhodococcus fascians]QII03817.1 hypothetical protein BH92_27540 [Rhodococcus fascians A21d2]